MLLGLILEGGEPAELIFPSAFIIVFGGTFGAALLSFPLKAVLGLPTLIMGAFKGFAHNAAETIDEIVLMADKARREGLLSLEEEANKIDNEYMRRGLMLVVDGVDAQQVRAIMHADTRLMSERHEVGISLLESMGAFAPTMGIIGTVMGLINVLKQLNNPEHLGEAIGAAFLATLWGVWTANLLWLPLGAKLKVKDQQEVEAREMVMEGVLALQAGENPRIVREKLSAFLPPKQRSKDDDGGK